VKRWANTVVLTLGIGSLLGAIAFKDRTETISLSDLVDALGHLRSIEPRITGGFSHIPCGRWLQSRIPIPLVRCSDVASFQSSTQRRTAELIRKIREQEESKSEEESFHLAGISYLAWPESESSFEAAVDYLERAVASSPHSGEAWSDLAAAYFALAQETVEPAGFMQSLSAAIKAVDLDPTLAEARFNKALALESLFLDSAAEREWKRYLELETDPGWAAEAYDHISRIRQRKSRAESRAEHRKNLRSMAFGGNAEEARKAVASFPDLARLAAEERLLGDWAVALSMGRSREAAEVLAAADLIGRALERANGERMILDSLAAIEEAQSDASLLDSLIAGHRLFMQGFALRKADRIAEASRTFLESRRRLVAAGSPFAHWASVQAAACEHFLGRSNRALALLRDVLNSPDLERYPCLEGRALWIKGLVYLGLGSLPEALESYELAADRFQRAGEIAHVGFLRSSIAVTLFNLGERATAWQQRYQGLATLIHIDDPKRVYTMLWEAAQASLAEGREEVALVFLDELLARKDLASVPGAYAEALLRRARILERLGKPGAAQENLSRATIALSKIEDPDFYCRVEADLLVAEAQAIVLSEPHRAAQALTVAQTDLVKRGLRVEALALYRERARAWVLSGRYALAEQDLLVGFREYESYRRKLRKTEERVAYFEQAQALAEDLVRLRIERQDQPAASLDIAERTRSRSLLDALRAGDGQAGFESADPLGAEAICRQIPEGSALIEYMILDDRLLIWLVRREGIELFVQKIAAADLEQAVERFRRELLSTPSSRPERWSLQLGDLLFGPLRGHLLPGTRLVFVPDRVLYGVPFAALGDGNTRRFLVEDYTIAVAPSATVYLKSIVKSRSLRGAEGVPLVVVNDTFDQDLFPRLMPLPATVREAEEIRRLFPGADLLRGQEATPQRFLQVAPQHRMIHIAGHAVTGPQSSALLMTPRGKGQNGKLSPGDLEGLELPATELVVLAACGTAVGGPVTREGLVSLAWPFLRAGVPAVVASLWNVEDDESASLFTEFYEQLSRDGDPAAALSDAQRRSLKEGSSPREWAGFQLIGGSAE
jgi:CHAT domain-containing protein